MKKMVLSAIAGVALAFLSTGAAMSASCVSVTGTCFVTGGTLTHNDSVNITEFFPSTFDGDFATKGDFAVQAGIAGAITKIAVSIGDAFFSPLSLSFDGVNFTDISSGGTKVFSLSPDIGGIQKFFIKGSVTTDKVLGYYDISLSAVPLPPAALLFGTALAGIGLLSRRRRAA